ncbi:hypothetical protein [Kiloniella spongiae]|uniref:hypothetical protein n=1 Tax=Kiloniella spongiae TaxID=1489064 RepID=UPI00194E8033|nr:hypothetical protein [Kiloniella spongiae]
MTFLHWLEVAFLFPGNVVVQKLGISLEEDGGILRSFINMCVWGVVTGTIAFYAL